MVQSLVGILAILMKVSMMVVIDLGKVGRDTSEI
jgi:hypothetical protein